MVGLEISEAGFELRCVSLRLKKRGPNLLLSVFIQFLHKKCRLYGLLLLLWQSHE